MSTQFATSKVPTLASDQLKPSKAGYGQNQFGGPSSDNPGERTASDFLPSDPVRDRLIREGHHDNSGTDDAVKDLERKIDTTPYPTTFGHKNPNASNPKLGEPVRPPKTR